MTSLKNNIYDRLLIFLICLQFFGIIGGPFQPVRIFIILCIPFLILSTKGKINRYKYEHVFFLGWIIYGLFTLSWVYIPIEGVKEIVYLCINFTGFFLILNLSQRAKQSQLSILKAWTLLFLITLPVALYEIWFDSHLPMNFINIAEGSHRRYASVTFGNLNNYNTILTYITPMLMGYILSNYKNVSKIKRTLYLLCFIMLFSVIIVNGSRAAMLCLFISILIFMRFYVKSIKSFIIFLFLFLIILAMTIYFYQSFLLNVFLRFEIQGFGDETRADIIKLSLKELKESFFMGIGAANLMPTMERYGLTITSSHNLFLEVGAQYGIIIFTLFIGIFVRVFFFQKQNSNIVCKFIIISSLCMMPFSSIISSGYITGINIWLFLSSLYVIADKRYTFISSDLKNVDEEDRDKKDI